MHSLGWHVNHGQYFLPGVFRRPTHDLYNPHATSQIKTKPPTTADAVRPGQRVVLLDDLLATGGTMAAGIALLRQVGAEVAGTAALIELGFLGGRERLDVPFDALVRYES